MRRVMLKSLLVLSLIVGSAGGVTSIASASDHESLSGVNALTKLYFPFVTNDTMVGDTGPWHSSITVQSMQSERVIVWVLPDGEFDPDRALTSFTLHSSYESRTVTASELGVDEDGESLVVAAMNFDVWESRGNPDGLDIGAAIGWLEQPDVTATLKQASPEPLDNGTWTSSSHEIVDGYSGIPMNDVGWGELSVDCPADDLNSCADVDELDSVDGMSYLPLAQSNDEWNTILYVSNVDGATDEASDVDVELIPTDNSNDDAESWTETDSLEPGETWAIDVAEEVGEGWTGSVRISSDAGTAAVAARHKSDTNMMLINTSAPSLSDDDGVYRLSAPLLYIDYHGWNTGISLANQSSSENDVSISLYDEDGDLFDTLETSLPAHGQGTIYLPSEVESDDNDTSGFLGSAVLESANGEPFHAAIDQVNYGNGAAMSSTLGTKGADAERDNERLGLPLLQKSGAVEGEGDTSGIQLFNPDPENSVDAEIRVPAAESGEVIPVELGPRESYNFHVVDDLDISVGSQLPVLVTVTGGEGQIVGVSNIVNYQVRGDGALVYDLTDGFGRFR